MGCCFSINTPNSKQHQNYRNTHQPHLRSPTPKSNATHGLNQRAAPSTPPTPIEEETVKEVLSETPISKPQVSILTAKTKTQLPKIQYPKSPIFEKEEEPVSEEVSQITETCSISESFSTTTTTATAASTVTTVKERREDEATSKRSTREGNHQYRYRSQSKRSHAINGNRIGGRERRPESPARTPAYPPENKIQASSRPARRRECGQVPRDAGEGPRRRSRSPSASGRAGAGNGRSQVKSPEIFGRPLPPVKRADKENGVSERVRAENDVVPREESLENPHVSLECFIFL